MKLTVKQFQGNWKLLCLQKKDKENIFSVKMLLFKKFLELFSIKGANF
jgi:hypothetical protein